MLLKLSLGSVMAMPFANFGQSHLQTSLPAAHQDMAAREQTQDRVFAANTQALPAPLPECHGHPANLADNPALDNTLAPADTKTSCASHADCHHCCPVGLGHWSGHALLTAPSAQHLPLLNGWQNANFRPLFRPPIA